MGILFRDGFDSFLATADLTKKYGSVGTAFSFVATGGRNGGGSLRLTNGSASQSNIITNSIADGSASNLYGFACWMKISALPTTFNNTIFLGLDASGAVMAGLGINTSGLLVAMKNSFGTLVVGTTNVCDNVWHWIEAIFSATTALGAFKCYVDGTVQFNTTANGDTTSNKVIDKFQISAFNLGGAFTITIDDLIIFNDQGASPIRTSDVPVGPQQITTVRPQADGVIGFLTATGGGTHFSQINEVNADGDTTYVESAVSNDQDLYDFAAMGVSPSSIKDVGLNAYVENPNVGSLNFKQIAKSGATQTDGTSTAVPAAYKTIQQSFPLDPNTSAAWASASAVDAATFGVKVV